MSRKTIEPVEVRIARFCGTPTASGCIPWTGARRAAGYGVIRIAGKNRQVSHVVWELHNGPVPEGELVCHRCDNPSCVNILHLFTGTPKENTQDMMRKGRGPTGERQGRSILTADVVRQVRLWLKEGLTHQVIADRCGVSRPAITLIATGRNWKHLL